MPRSGPRRPLVALRLSEQGIEQIDRRALVEGLTIRNGAAPNRSKTIRRLVAYGLAHMPEGWEPAE
jgi:hypothetical protein